MIYFQKKNNTKHSTQIAPIFALCFAHEEDFLIYFLKLTSTSSNIIVVPFLQVWKIISIIVTMKRHIQHTWVVIENVLDAVSVVNVPVKDEDLFHVMNSLGILGGYCN